MYLKSKTWESRVAAGEAITAIVQHVPLWGNCKGKATPAFIKSSYYQLHVYYNYVNYM